jgi:ankyrin repeat protein
MEQTETTLMMLPADILDDIFIRARTPALICVNREFAAQAPEAVVACALGRATYGVDFKDVLPSVVKALHAFSAHGKDRYIDIAIVQHVRPNIGLDRLLRAASMMRDAAVVRALLRHGASDADGRELARAASVGDLDLVDALMVDDKDVPRLRFDKSGKVDDRSKRRRKNWIATMGIALVGCAEKGHARVASTLTESMTRNGAEWFARTPMCSRAYKRAIANGHREVMEALHRFGTPVDFDQGGAIVLAVASNQTEVVRDLIQKNAEPDGLGGKPLVDACTADNAEIVRLLLSTRRVSSVSNGAALIRAAEKGSLSIVRLLLLMSSGAGTLIINTDAARTAHNRALFNKRVDIVYEITRYMNHRATCSP